MLGTLELLQSHPAPRMRSWQRKGSGLTWLPKGNDAANEQDGSKSDAKPNQRSRDSQLPGKDGTTKLLFSKAAKPKAASLHNSLSWRCWNGETELLGDAGREQPAVPPSHPHPRDAALAHGCCLCLE